LKRPHPLTIVGEGYRPLHGGRGLKLRYEWIDVKTKNRPLHGGRGLKHFRRAKTGPHRYRPLHGGRGLKLRTSDGYRTDELSPPSRGARIETRSGGDLIFVVFIAPFTGGAD